MTVAPTMFKRTLATAELLLIFPAALFMTALFVRNVTPVENEPAHTAQQIVMWYAARPHLGLWVLLIALPTVVMVSGGGALLFSWHEDTDLRQAARQALVIVRAHLATLLVALATLSAAAILLIVAVHVLTD